jgi:hypothetical protein
MHRYYRFWSLDPVFTQIVDLVQKKGTTCSRGLHTETVLFEGVVYDYGKPSGFTYPTGSTKIIGMDPEPTVSFPARLIITTETLEKMLEIEKRFGLEDIPDKYREAAHPKANLADYARPIPSTPIAA